MIAKVIFLLAAALATCESAGLSAAPLAPYGHGYALPALSSYHAPAIGGPLSAYHAPIVPAIHATPALSAYHAPAYPAISSYSPLPYHGGLAYHPAPIRAYAAPLPAYSTPYGIPYGHGTFAGRYAL